jgi:hypothetical protein
MRQQQPYLKLQCHTIRLAPTKLFARNLMLVFPRRTYYDLPSDASSPVRDDPDPDHQVFTAPDP